MPFVYVKIPLVAGIAQRLDALHALVQDALAAQALGEISSWGSSLPGTGAGTRSARARPTHHRLDIEVHDLAAGLPLLRQTLAAAPVPVGTELHYTDGGLALQQDWAADAWGAPAPSTGTHRPGG